MEILRDFFDLRLEFYVKRKRYMVGLLQAEANKLSNQVHATVVKKNRIHFT